MNDRRILLTLQDVAKIGTQFPEVGVLVDVKGIWLPITVPSLNNSVGFLQFYDESNNVIPGIRYCAVFNKNGKQIAKRTNSETPSTSYPLLEIISTSNYASNAFGYFISEKSSVNISDKQYIDPFVAGVPKLPFGKAGFGSGGYCCMLYNEALNYSSEDVYYVYIPLSFLFGAIHIDSTSITYANAIPVSRITLTPSYGYANAELPLYYEPA